MTTASEVLSRYVVADDGCWHYTGLIDPTGYGRVTLSNPRRTIGLHRLAHETWIGPIPDGHHVDHVCHNGSGCIGRGAECLHRRCINPWHLEAVPPKVNVNRSHLHAGARTECVHGHPYDEVNTRYQRTRRGVQRYCLECRRASNRVNSRRQPARRAS